MSSRDNNIGHQLYSHLGKGESVRFSAIEIAEFFLFLANKDVAGDLISNLKIQKLVYYSQGLHLAIFDSKLFVERIEAWTHGPVVPKLYFHYKKYGADALPYPEQINHLKFDDFKTYLERVYTVYGQFSAWKLRAMTHQEQPWISTPKGAEIPTNLLKNFFSEELQKSPFLATFHDFVSLDKTKDISKNNFNLSEKEPIPPPVSYINYLYNNGEIGAKDRDLMTIARIDYELKIKMLTQFYLSTKY